MQTKCFDHKGIAYQSQTERAKAYDIAVGTVRKRMKNGWPLEQALTVPPSPDNSKNTATDHKGILYKSFEAMCRSYNQPSGRVHSRIKRGWTLKEALLTPVNEENVTSKIYNQNISQKNIVYDHNGKLYKSFEAMCRSYNQPSSRVQGRLKRRWPLEQALLAPSKGKSRIDSQRNMVHDHNGNEYGSELEMCKAWGRNNSTYRDRRRRGWSVKDALTKENVREFSSSVPRHTDHEGNAFTSFDSMCSKWGQKTRTVRNRIERSNWSLQRALTTPPGQSRWSFRKQIESSMNKWVMADNGLMYIITGYIQQGNHYRILGKFIDNTKFSASEHVVRNSPYRIPHPNLKPDGRYRTNFLGFDVRYMFNHGIDAYYFTKCKTCGKTYIYTAMEMYEHRLLESEQDVVEPKKLENSNIFTATVPWKDHIGKMYASFGNMAEAYSMDISTLLERLESGWTLKKALTTKIKYPEQITDHLGNTYESFEIMCKVYGKSDGGVRKRLRDGWKLHEALCIPSKFGVYISTFKRNKVLFLITGKDYRNFSCPICGNSYIFNINDVLKHLLAHIERSSDITNE